MLVPCAMRSRWTMVEDGRKRQIERCGRLIDIAELGRSMPARPLARLSIVRRSTDPAADMGDWVIDEAEERLP